MGRRDPDPRPSIEIVGAEPPVESLQRVSAGPGGGTGGRRALLVAAGVALLLVGGLALGGGDDGSPKGDEEEAADRDTSTSRDRASTTTRPRTTTTRPTTTTTTTPPGPVFGPPTGAALLVWSSGGWRVVDLDTGVHTRVDLASDRAWEAVAVTGGVVMVADDGSREALFTGFDRHGAVSDPVELGPADQVLADVRRDRVWLVDGGGRVYEGGSFVEGEVDVRLVDLGGRVLRSFRLEGGRISEAVEDGVILERAGRVYLANERGVRPVAVGVSLGVADDELVLLTCDDLAQCGIRRQPVDGRAPDAPLVTEPGIEDAGYEGVAAADGRFALLRYGAEGGDLVLSFYGADGRPAGQLADGSSYFNGLPRWLPGDAGLVATDGAQLLWIRMRDGEWGTEPVRPFEQMSAEIVHVIEW